MVRGPRIRDELRRVGVRPVKERGQNFLHDHSVIESIVLAGGPKPEDQIVEIGPGLGALTSALAVYPKLTVIEIEDQFANEIESEYPAVSVVRADVLDVNFSALGERLLVFGNLPYSMSTDIVFHILSQRSAIRRAVFLLQKEFVDRMAAPPGSRTYGSLSVACQIYADVRAGIEVSGDCFHPRTKVSSRVAILDLLPTPRVELPDPKHFERVVRAAFHQRRKKIHNSLASTGLFPGIDLRVVLTEAGIDPDRRAETVSIEEFARLVALLK